jgi:hypothetical protein
MRRESGGFMAGMVIAPIVSVLEVVLAGHAEKPLAGY